MLQVQVVLQKPGSQHWPSALKCAVDPVSVSQESKIVSSHSVWPFACSVTILKTFA